jgi:hypothetical protein
MISETKFQEIIKKINEAKTSGQMDLSTEEDLSIAVMNLISLEEHFFFTAEKTGKPEYFDMLKEVRSLRKELLGKMIDRTEGETWCVSKHLLAASMRLLEVGTKLLGENGESRKTEAEDFFHKAYKLYSLFWALKFKLISAGELKAETKSEGPMSVEDLVAKLVDCCKE